MQYMYAALLLHSAGKKITESSIEEVLKGAGIAPDEIRVKALVAALSEINIDEALKMQVYAPAQVAAPSVTAAVEEKKAEEKPKEEKKEEEDLQGLSALFG